MPRGKNKTINLLSIFFCAFIIFLFIQFLRIHSFPKDFRIVPGQELQFSLKKPFSLYLPAKRPQGIIGFNGTEKLPEGTGGYCTTVTLRPEQEGHSTLEIRFLGLTIRKVNLRVLNMPEVIPGGHAVGVLLADHGVLVVGHLPVKDEEGKEHYPARDAGIKVGDLLVAINGYPIARLEEVDGLIQSLCEDGKPLRLTLIRDGVKRQSLIYPVKRINDTPRGKVEVYLLGLYIEDPAAGVGTLTYFNPKTRRFGALGHRIVGFGNREIPLNKGKLVSARITGINLSNRGEPGEKIGVFTSNEDIIGEIEANTALGIFGTLKVELTNMHSPAAIPVAAVSEVTTGPAEIMTVISGDEIRRFTIEIQRVYQQNEVGDKGLVIKITDPLLLTETGGIIQGMSGSPIIQNGKLVGAVTHVFVNDPTRGYGVFAEWMLEMDKSLLNVHEKRAS